MSVESHKKIVYIVVVALFVFSFVMLLKPFLSALDSSCFGELLHGFRELSGAAANTARQPPLSNDFVFGLPSFLFALAATFIGYRMNRQTTLICVVQLSIATLFYQWLTWTTSNLQGFPLCYLLSVLFGALAGSALKSLDEGSHYADSLRAELELRNSELLESRIAIVKQDERERRLLAADLHDQVLNDLKKISQDVESFSSGAESVSAQKIQTDLRTVMSDVREIMDNLCPVVLEHFGLPAAVEECLEKGAQRAGFEFSFEQRAPESLVNQLSVVEKQLIFRLIQESITNICKHAQAASVSVTFEDVGNQLVVTVDDDGKGIAKESIAESSRGLQYMKLRAALIGAQIHWLSGNGRIGTRVEIRALPPASSGETT